MHISSTVREHMVRASWIRRMFEEGNRLRQIHGADAVIDLSLGNPEIEPPPSFREVLARAAAVTGGGLHRYMANAGYPDTREAVAARLREETGLPVAGSAVVMSCGAAGALNVVLKAILDPGDEVITLAPYFPEYEFYIGNHGGVMRPVPTRPDFGPDPVALAQALGPRTRAVIVNSPNNPTGRVYTEDEIGAIATVLAERAPDCYLISDEPYKRLCFEGFRFIGPLGRYRRVIVVGSHSKDLGIPGERIGYVAVSPEIDAEERRELLGAFTFVNRTLGFVNAPALMQRVVRELQGVTIDPGEYQRRRDLIVPALESFGYEVVRPGGAFYLFPKSPDEDDTRFVSRLSEKLVLTVPGSGFGAPGHFRVSYCVAEDSLRRALPAFEALAREYGLPKG